MNITNRLIFFACISFFGYKMMLHTAATINGHSWSKCIMVWETIEVIISLPCINFLWTVHTDTSMICPLVLFFEWILCEVKDDDFLVRCREVIFFHLTLYISQEMFRKVSWTQYGDITLLLWKRYNCDKKKNKGEPSFFCNKKKIIAYKRVFLYFQKDFFSRF